MAMRRKMREAVATMIAIGSLAGLVTGKQKERNVRIKSHSYPLGWNYDDWLLIGLMDDSAYRGAIRSLLVGESFAAWLEIGGASGLWVTARRRGKKHIEFLKIIFVANTPQIK